MTTLTRRHLLLSGAAATLATPAFTSTDKDWTMPEAYKPRIMRIKNKLAPNEIHVDPGGYALYWTMEDRQALRFTVGIGRASQYERGTFTIKRKREWPRWTPTAAMIKREPKIYKQYEDGMAGGPKNPLGARALYLHTASGRDSMLRIHGTNRPWTIHTASSNGCVRMTNDDVIALYDMVPIGTRVVLH